MRCAMQRAAPMPRSSSTGYRGATTPRSASAPSSLQTDSFTHLHQRLDQVLVQLSEDALSVVDQTNRPRAGTTRRAAVPENKVKERGADQLKKLLGDANRRAREERES